MWTNDSRSRAAVIAAAVLSAVTALCEYLSVMFMPGRAVMGFLLVSFLLDMVFTALFVSDFAEAVKRHKLRSYMLHGRGLVDFCGAIPVFFLYSAPSVIILAAGSQSAAVNFMKAMTFYWGVLCVTGILRVSRLTRLASLRVFYAPGMTERHITFICTIICAAVLPAAPVCALILQKSGAAQNFHAAAGFIPAFMLFIILPAVVVLYSRLLGSTVSSVLDSLDRGFRRREFYLKIRISEEFRDEPVMRIASFYNESYLPAKIKQNINSPEPAAYRIPEDEVKNFIRNR